MPAKYLFKTCMMLLLGSCLTNSIGAADTTNKQLPVISQPSPPPAPPVIYDSPAPPPEPPGLYAVAAPPPKIPSIAEWLKTETVKVDPSVLVSDYQRLLTDKLIKSIIKPTPDANGVLKESEQQRYNEATELAKRTAKQGYLQGYHDFLDADGSFWIFDAAENSASPERLMQVSFPNPKQYVMQMRMRCSNIDELCSKMAEKYFKTMAVPPPISHSWEARYQWLQVRSQQPCINPGPIRMRSPNYPAGHIKDDKEKEVKIRFITDACGIPISVKVDKSSGNRNLDKIAIDAVWKWRVKLPENKLSVPLYSLREFTIPLKFIPPLK